MCRLSTADVRTIPVAAFGTHSVFPHQPRDTMLAACLACLSQVEEDAWRTVHALTWVERRADHVEPLMLAGKTVVAESFCRQNELPYISSGWGQL